jgi:methylmalonyl-CoA mutase
VGSFAAAVGNADSIATAPFDGLRGPEADAVDGLGPGSELGRRLALNTQLILREESQLARVIDPAGGSWYVESLTDALARAAWLRFRELEQRGGLLAGLQAGSIQADIERAAARLRERAATRKLPLTGLSTYATLDDPSTPEQPCNATVSEGPEPLPISPDHVEVAPLGRLRLAAPFVLRSGGRHGVDHRVVERIANPDCRGPVDPLAGNKHLHRGRPFARSEFSDVRLRLRAIAGQPPPPVRRART